jgi:hypothetical protein
MQVVDLPEEHTSEYLMCLEDWSEDMKDAGDRKRPGSPG